MLDKKLKALLKSKNMSVTELAKATGVPKTNIQQWMTGSSPNIVQADKVAAYFGISLEELVFDRKPKNSIEEIFSEALIHTGHYKIQITKLTKKEEGE
jgi:transcriptional regulator with XRE-family HTH domain